MIDREFDQASAAHPNRGGRPRRNGQWTALNTMVPVDTLEGLRELAAAYELSQGIIVAEMTKRALRRLNKKKVLPSENHISL
jgi:hypothetical protein